MYTSAGSGMPATVLIAIYCTETPESIAGLHTKNCGYTDIGVGTGSTIFKTFHVIRVTKSICVGERRDETAGSDDG